MCVPLMFWKGTVVVQFDVSYKEQLEVIQTSPLRLHVSTLIIMEDKQSIS